jgi:magnesium chelatase family protein
LLDRIDIHVEVTPVSFEELTNPNLSEGSKDIRKRVESARNTQKTRYKNRSGIHCNAQMSKQEFDSFCKLDENGNQIIKKAMDSMGLSARAYDRILKVARTIADLDESQTIEAQHLAEAIQYRSLDKSNWSSN